MISVPIASLTLTSIMAEQSDLISVVELLDDIKERLNINGELEKYNLFLSIMHDFRHEECVNLPSACL